MITGIIFAFIVFLFSPECQFKKIFNISCSICGMTRAFIFILNGNIISALKMNLLSIPLFIMITLFVILYLLNIILKKEYVYKFYNYIIKHYKLLILIFIINWIINIIKTL